MSLNLPPASPPPAPAPEGDPNAALEAQMFGGLDAVRAAKQAAEKFTPLDLKCARLERTDFGNGQRLRERFGDQLIWVKDIGWHGWSGKHWSQELGEVTANKLADDTHLAVYAEAKALAEAGPWPRELPEEFEARVAAQMAWAIVTGNVNKRNAMLASAVTYLTKTAADIDADPMLFNCENCTLDLSNHEEIKRRRHSPRDVITRLSPVKFDQKALAPRFKAFLDRILPDKAVQRFMQQWAGISLTGDISVQSLVLMHGTGANGKSTLDEVLRYIFGDYAKTVAFASLLRDDKRRGGEASPDLARLRGARAAFASEPEQSVQFSEGLIKQMTGGEPITARFLNKEFFEYLPQFKLWLAFNTKPTVRGTDTGIWRRLKLVPFEVTIPPEERDPHLVEKLKAEASGVLNWILDGFRDWRDHGLIVPDAVRAATQEYREESDPIGQFIADAIERVPGGKISAGAVYEAYHHWCRVTGSHALGQTLVGRRMGATFEKVHSGGKFYVDCQIKAEWVPRHRGEPPPPSEPDQRDEEAI
jgi:putative DNA primase/helicase